MMNPKPFQKRIAIVLLAIFLPSLMPFNLLYASNNGPNAPEAQGFESVTATDMVNLSSGDMSYVLPLMDVNGFPVTLSYHGGIPLDLESSWVGLGWNLNTGAINRGLNASPDDWLNGKSLDFLRFQNAEEIYSINVGIGISQCLEAGVGMSWGSNKGVTGSVYAQASLYGTVGVGGSIDTNGNYSLSASVGYMAGGTSYGANVGVAGNVSGGKTDVGVGAGVRFSNGMTVGMGVSLTGGGTSVSLGYSNGQGGNKSLAGSGSLSMSNFSQGDWDIESKGWYIPIQIYCFTAGFGKRKTTYTLEKSYKKEGNGILYSSAQSNLNETNPDNVFFDYQNRFKYGDVYEQALPQTEKEFVGDYEAERLKNNFTYAGYDNYDINATGISGALRPVIYDNMGLFGMGYIGDNQSTDDANDKQRVYYHKTNGTKALNSSYSFPYFNFEGQYTTNNLLIPLEPKINSSSTGNSISNNLTAKPAVVNQRFAQGNFIEVFTNSQIHNNQSSLLIPENIPNSSRTPENGFVSDGIGGYKITASDGKIYHFSVPVYHYEMVNRNILKDDSENHVSEKRQYTPYATHWLLTAITGPDYFDTNNNKIADEGDYGYWIRLKHSKWSDGYVWRSPTDKNFKEYSTNLESKVGKDDFGNYQFGRKQLYYLDKIVSNSHTAYFVKDLRYDSSGCDLNYFFNGTCNLENKGIGAGLSKVCENFTYKKQMQLMLKKIVMVKNSDAIVFENSINSETNQLQLNTASVSDYVDNYNIGFDIDGGFANVYGANYNIKLNQEQNVIDVKDFESFDFSKAIKVVDFGYNYNLAVKDHNYTAGSNLSNGSPGVIKNTAMNPNHGKLTLKSVKFLGRNNFDYMPPYQFDYNGEFINASQPYVAYPANAIAQRSEVVSNTGQTTSSWSLNYQGTAPTYDDITIETPIQNIRAKDEWGFRKERPEAWSMTKIKTPTGASIEFEHEEDDFHIEAFSRRYWTDNLEFRVRDFDSNNILIDIQDQAGQGSLGTPVDFSKYFSINDDIFLDLWICRVENSHYHSPDHGWIDINSSTPFAQVHSVNNLTLTLKINRSVLHGDHANLVMNSFFSKSYGSNRYQGTSRNCPDPPDGGDHHKMAYKLLASRVPKEETGGGLRVKSITLKDENNNNYKTKYYYNVPGTNKVKNVGDYKSSGITSYSPVKGLKYVPYQSELPSPGVMYEYVTMVSENIEGQNIGETRYRFYVLRPVLDIFNENIIMRYDPLPGQPLNTGEVMFAATVQNYNGSNGYFDSNAGKKIQAKSISLKVNTSLIGQFRSVEEYNKAGQLIMKSEKRYLSGESLKALASLPSTNPEKVYRGAIRESFQSMKSVFDTDSGDNNPILNKRLLSVSSKEDQTSVLESTIAVNATGKTTEWYKGSDPMTGTFNIIEKQKADGKLSRIERVPAYSKYAQMGSKVTSATNKNMLTQDAMSISSVKIGNVWKTTDANITTWNDSWSYRNENNGSDILDTNNKVWRKHKSFAWKDELKLPGVYLTTITKDNSQFNWGLGTPISDKWQKLSEITRYTRWSMPIETKDINGNFASTKMADNDAKVLVSGNARYTEMYYSGAEYVKSGNLFDGEVKGASFRSDDASHTGKYSVKAENITDKVFEVTGSTGSTDYYNVESYTSTFRPGKYKISVWALEEGNPIQNAKLTVNGIEINLSETVKAGCWRQLNYYFDLPINSSNNISITAKSINGKNYFDDFRMCPIASNVNSYVYDRNTDELSYTLDVNNMGSAFKYDNAGRLVANYSEIADTPTLLGGFKITSQFKQKYKGTTDVQPNAAATIDNCFNSVVLFPMTASISTECWASFENKYKTNVTGGSGNFSYEYKWVVDYNNNTYSNYVAGSNTMAIPYVPIFCSPSTYNKSWKFKVRVTDNVTGQIIEVPYQFNSNSCYNTYDYPNDFAFLQVTKCFDLCGNGDYSFKVHLKNIGLNGNFKYEYATYQPYDPSLGNTFETQTLFWNDVTSTQGRFCPQYSLISTVNCPSGEFRKIYYIAFRITNLNTGEVSTHYPYNVVGDCESGALLRGPIIQNEHESNILNKYLEEGNIIKRDNKGIYVKEVENINDKMK